MYKLTILIIAGTLLCGAAVAQKAQEYEACTSDEDCSNNCCFGGRYCAPSVSLDGSCPNQRLKKACDSPKTKLAGEACPIIKEIIKTVPVVRANGLLSELSKPLRVLVGAIISLLEHVLDLNPLLTGLKFLLKLVFGLLGGVGYALGDVLGAVNYLVDALLVGLLGL